MAAQQLQRDDGDGLVQDDAVELRQAAGVLDGDQPRLRQPGRLGAGDRQRQRPRRQLGVRGDEAARLGAARALTQLGADGGQRVVGQLAPEDVQRLRLAAAVEDHDRAADQRRERRGDRVEAALGEHDPLQALLDGDRALQQRVLLVDQPRERLLGDRR